MSAKLIGEFLDLADITNSRHRPKEYVGCLAAGSKIPTKEGIKPIEDIVLGDMVLACELETSSLVWEEVTGKKHAGLRPIGVMISNGLSIHCSYDHMFLMFAKGSKKQYYYKPARKIRSKTGVVVDRGMTHAQEFIDEGLTKEVGCLRLQPLSFEHHGASEDTWDIEVSGDGNFVCEGFIVHNSSLSN